MEAKSGPLERRIKKQYHWDEIFLKNSRLHPLDNRRKEEVLEEMQAEPVDEKLRRHKSNWLAITFNKNEHQQGAKINAGLYTKWTKTTWNAFDEAIRRGRIRPVKA